MRAFKDSHIWEKRRNLLLTRTLKSTIGRAPRKELDTQAKRKTSIDWMALQAFQQNERDEVMFEKTHA